MLKTSIVLAGLLSSLLLAGCGVGVETSPAGDSETSTHQALAGGCRLVCPRCHPGEVCPMIACVEDCAPAPKQCLENQLCIIGYVWSQPRCSCVPAK